uniref:Pseudouridylate synthase 1 homolog n=1 Tax=Tabanus bromius TaxID=304241 RepID=A0A0K8TSA7_TABBR
MSEALEKHEQEQIIKAKQQKYKPRYNGKIKKRKWEANDNADASAEKTARTEPTERIKKKKCLILLGYSGVNYFGMQRNPGMKTIEEDLFKAMLEAKWINDEGFNQAQMINFQRAARTDKGVSASRQCCSLKLPSEVELEALNKNLPEQIRVFCVKRVTKGFNCKDQCNARTYTYTLPTIALSDHTCENDMKSYRVPQEKIKQMNDILKKFEGTKNFHNFTSRKGFMDPSSKRYIISFECSEPFLSPDDVEFTVIKIKGQSFMMHQIRKMIGLAIAVLRGHTEENTIDKAFSEERLDIPMSPGLGLVLDQVHYDRYNERYGEDGIHEPLTWEKVEPDIKNFADKYIYSTIYKTELEENSMINWLKTLHLHTYDIREEDESPPVEQDNVKTQN